MLCDVDYFKRYNDSLGALEDQLVNALAGMERDTARIQSICNWE